MEIRWVKRGINWSSFMYILANFITLAEINKTVVAVRVPTASKIRGNEMEVVWIVRRCQWSINNFCDKRK